MILQFLRWFAVCERLILLLFDQFQQQVAPLFIIFLELLLPGLNVTRFHLTSLHSG